MGFLARRRRKSGWYVGKYTEYNAPMTLNNPHINNTPSRKKKTLPTGGGGETSVENPGKTFLHSEKLDLCDYNFF
jgi:hypothetical protein